MKCNHAVFFGSCLRLKQSSRSCHDSSSNFRTPRKQELLACPQQPEDYECGYYVMKWMYDITFYYCKSAEIHFEQSSQCFLCGMAPEDHTHLFFQCDYSRKCCDIVSDWCKFRIPYQNSVNWWVTKRFRSLCQKKIIGVILAALIYHLWMNRNRCRVDFMLCRPEVLFFQVKHDATLRLHFCNFRIKKASVQHWVSTICSR